MSMELETTRLAVLQRFEAAWTGAAAVPVQRPNQQWKQPETGPWGRLTVIYGNRQSVALGGTRKRQTNLVELQLFAPEDTGTAKLTEAADLFAAVFDEQQLAPAADVVIAFDNAGVTQAGRRQGYEQIVASVSFRVDKTT